MMKNSAAECLEKMESYYKERATLAKASARHPNIDDYARALSDLDNAQFACMRQAVVQLRDQYVAMHHYLVKNWRLITQPRD